MTGTEYIGEEISPVILIGPGINGFDLVVASIVYFSPEDITTYYVIVSIGSLH